MSNNDVIDDFEREPLDGEVEEEHALTFTELIQSVMTQTQFDILRGKTPAYAVRVRQGKGGSYSYVPHGYVRDQLNKAFGFDFDFEIVPCFNNMPYVVNVSEATLTVPSQKDVTVMGKLTVRIRNPRDVTIVVATIVKQEPGGQPWLAGQDFNDALKGASSDALKRCALNLGVGLDLYYDEERSQEAYAAKQAALGKGGGKSLKDLVGRKP